MERLKECIDTCLVGVVIGLGIGIFIAVTVITVEVFNWEKEQAYLQSFYEESIEQRRLELEGWIE